MTVTIPRAEVHAISQPDDGFRLTSDPTTELVRLVADEYRREADGLRGILGEDYAIAAGLLAEADALDALADRCERQAG